MSAPSADPAPSTDRAPEVPDEPWRGVATEDDEEVDAAVGLRLAARSRRLLRSLLRPHRRPVAVALALLLLDQLALLAGPLLVGVAIDTAVPAAVAGRPVPLALCVAGYAAASLLDATLAAAFIRLSGRIGQDVLLDLRERVFAHGQRLSLSFHERYTSGRLISRLTSDLDALQALLDNGLDGLLSLVSVVGIATVLLVLDPSLALVALAGLLPLAALTRRYLRRSSRTYRTTRTWIARVIVQFVESVNGLRAVQAYRREDRNDALLARTDRTYGASSARAMVLFAGFSATARVIGNLSVAAVLLWGGLQVVDGQLELGLLASFVLYLRRLYDPLDQLAMIADSYSSAVAALEKVSGVLDEPATVADPARPAGAPPPRGEVVLDRARFGYGDGREVLPRTDLVVPAGQVVALVGATGAGKSTLAKLVARFYDPVDGAVRLDGVDLRDLADADLRRRVVLVTQESFLFGGSVADNIALARPSASRDEVVAAARAVGADGFVEALPDGYDTDVRKRGTRLSAGQRQLVSFARALLADPAVLVLDEATSSLDLPSERAVQAALETVLAGRTAIVIAHRLSTVLVADRVLVLDGGRVVEDGSPAELLADGGAFADLHGAWRDSLA